MEGPPVFCRTNDSAVTHDAAVGGVGTVDKGFEERLEKKDQDYVGWKNSE